MVQRSSSRAKTCENKLQKTDDHCEHWPLRSISLEDVGSILNGKSPNNKDVKKSLFLRGEDIMSIYEMNIFTSWIWFFLKYNNPSFLVVNFSISLNELDRCVTQIFHYFCHVGVLFCRCFYFVIKRAILSRSEVPSTFTRETKNYVMWQGGASSFA